MEYTVTDMHELAVRLHNLPDDWTIKRIGRMWYVHEANCGITEGSAQNVLDALRMAKVGDGEWKQ